jgi:RND family efflux transporter MFP subunit
LIRREPLESGKRRAALLALSVLIAALAAGCGPAEQDTAEPVRPVRVTAVAERKAGESLSLTGHIGAQEEVNLAFRIGGRMIERPVNIGDRISAGQVVARLEEEPTRNALRMARANLTSVQSLLTRTQSDFARQQRLITSGATSRADFDHARQAMEAAYAQVDAAKAQFDTAQDQLGYTRLIANAAGTVTARGAEPGEVVEPGRMILRVALDTGRDAVFDVPELVLRTTAADAGVSVALASDPGVRARGRVREVSPQADPVTRTFQVRIGLIDPPAALRLGSTVIGTLQLDRGPAISVPAAALVRSNQQPAVWVVDRQNSTVSLRPVEVSHYDLATVVLAGGLDPGDLVVTAGVQALRPGQKVRTPETAPPRASP